MAANVDAARGLLGALAPALNEAPDPCPEGCHRALDHALITAPDARDPALCARLDAVAGRVLGG
ncbi:MAG: S-methyl-5'-thioadenosine phosphorylase, partial [Alphaproteobacteria bacterium]